VNELCQHAVLHPVHGQAVFAQRLFQALANHVVVFHQQDAHARTFGERPDPVKLIAEKTLPALLGGGLCYGRAVMESNQAASQTALGTAYLRAAHQMLDGEPKLLDDPVAVTLLGPDARARIQANAEDYRRPMAEVLRAHVVLRSRFTEDRLADAVSRGTTQYILLGAGLDTFGFRQPQWAQSLRILEVDHAQTQLLKRQLMDAADLPPPANVSYVSVDFERESLQEGLLRHGVEQDETTFFSWLGVTMYLREPAIDAVLRFVAGFPSGSEIVLTFAQPPDDKTDSTAWVAARTAAMNEPMISFFTPAAMEIKLRRAGFSGIDFLSPKESEIRYFSQRPLDLPVPKRTAIVAAQV
jgi:methyltransferase (TIGR00027 family)